MTQPSMKNTFQTVPQMEQYMMPEAKQANQTYQKSGKNQAYAPNAVNAQN